MAEKLMNLVNKVTLDYILEQTSTCWKEGKQASTFNKENEKSVFSKKALDYISRREGSLRKRQEHNNANAYRSEEETNEMMHKYGVILFYDLFKGILKKSDRKYYNLLKKEIREKAGNAEIDIDYLEKLMPFMKSLNVLDGIYNKEYTLEDKETISFGYSISTGGRKTKEVREESVIIPYNLRKNSKITASVSE